MSLGTWNSPLGCGNMTQLSGDVQNYVGGGAPEINITGNSNSIADGDVTPANADGTDYGNAAIAVGSSQTFVINNTGTAALNITSIVVSGAQASDSVVSGITTPANVQGKLILF